MSRRQVDELLAWAARFEERTWAVESAGGVGYLLAQQLVAAGERVLDVPATLAARVRVLASGRSNKNDANDGYSIAVAALRAPNPAPVTAADHASVLRLLAKRNKQLGGSRDTAALFGLLTSRSFLPSRQMTSECIEHRIDSAQPNEGHHDVDEVGRMDLRGGSSGPTAGSPRELSRAWCRATGVNGASSVSGDPSGLRRKIAESTRGGVERYIDFTVDGLALLREQLDQLLDNAGAGLGVNRPRAAPRWPA